MDRTNPMIALVMTLPFFPIDHTLRLLVTVFTYLTLTKPQLPLVKVHLLKVFGLFVRQRIPAGCWVPHSCGFIA
jgi:hypothetical protein